SPTTLGAHISAHAHIVSSTTSGTCGATLNNTASFTSDNGGSGEASASVSVVGPASTAFSESFDGIAAPALPLGWTATNAQGASPLWVTSTVSPDTAPNDAFVDDPASVSDKRLESPSIAIQSTSAQLSFRNNYNLESGFDGGVLEVAIGGAAYQDIIAAGGSFVSGGYNASISREFGNPLAGRSAWSGSSAGYVSTVLNLPAAAAGQNIRLRWP